MMEPANLLKIKSLSYGWCDKDIVMLHACFQLLVDCVEKENLLDGHIDWEYNDEFKLARAELQALYDWWQKRTEWAADDDFDELDPPVYEEDTRQLIKLIEWRHMLWT
jgi:hypothetical protein